MPNPVTRKTLLAGSLAVAVFSGCGGKNDSKNAGPGQPTVAKCESGDVGCGFTVQAGSDGLASISFPKAAAGQQYVLLPYSIGDSHTVTGGATNATSAITVNGAAALRFASPKHASRQDNWRSQASLWHLALNRFDLGKGANQGAEFWDLVHRIDHSESQTATGEAFAPNGSGAAETFFRENIEASAKRPAHGFTPTAHASLLSGGCPDTVLVPGHNSGGALTKDGADSYATKAGGAVKDVVDGGDFCIVYLDDPVSEPNKDAIKTSLTNIISEYKTTIYKDTFADVGSYTFKPVVVVVDFSNANEWPSALAGKFFGLFIGAMSTNMGRPAFYMASDFSKVKAGTTSDVARPMFHSTLAHEMQHAIIDYYRVRKFGIDPQMTALDEGIAHLMEDVFGYGAENFPFYAESFLQTFGDGVEPAIRSDYASAPDPNKTRGAANTLLYYLASQKGGFSFDAGKLSGGAGLDFIRQMVTVNDATKGAVTLAETYGGDWSATMGNYFGSLVLDGSKVANVGAQFQVQSTAQVTDLQGASKTFGMRFNGFDGFSEDYTQFKASSADDVKSGLELSAYETIPLLHTISNPATTVTVKWPSGTAGAAVTAVRIK